MATDKKRELLELVRSKAFEPVMRARAEERSDAERRKLEDVQQATKAEIERYENYSSAEELVTNFKRDLSSDAARKIHRELKSLGLPTIGDIRDEFEKKARDLGVQAST